MISEFYFMIMELLLDAGYEKAMLSLTVGTTENRRNLLGSE